jgi:hypothetical protein
VLLGRALKLKRDERWASAAAMREAVAEAAETLAEASPPPVEPPLQSGAQAGGSGQRRARRLVVIGAALVGVALLAAVGISWLPRIAVMEGQITPTPTATRRPASAAVEPATAVIAPSAQAATVTDAPTLPATDTPMPALSPTATKRPATATLIAAAASAATPVPPATRSTPVRVSPERSPLPPPTPALQVTLLEPAPGSALSGLAAFSWQANRPPLDNQALELVFWQPGQDPLNDGLGIIGYNTEQAGMVWIDLPSIEKQLGDLFRPGDYLWGVRSIQIAPYQRYRMVSEPRAMRYGAGSSGSPPAVPPTAVPPTAMPPTAVPPTDVPPPPVTPIK